MSELRPYPKYKDSGVEWIGEIPEDWVLTKIKRIAKVSSSKRIYENQYQESGIPFYRSKEIVELSKGKKVSANLFINQDVYSEIEYKYGVPQKNDLLITSIGTIGEVWISDGRKFYYKDGNITQLKAEKNLHINFLKYCFNSNLFNEQYNLMSDGSTLMALTIEKINELLVILPRIDQQKTITNFLDPKTVQIDSLIADKERLIELLEEKRQAVITETVTKGLDPNVKMKDSGIEWIGKIPEHWDIVKLKWLSEIELSNVDKKTVKGEEPVLLCNYVDVYYNNIITLDLDFMDATAKKEEINKFSLKEDDVIITKDSEDPNDIAVPTWVSQTMGNVLCGYHLAHIRPKPALSGKYLLYCLLSTRFQEQFHSLAYGVTRYGILKGDIENSLFNLPPFYEQVEISEYLTKVDKKIESIVCQIKDQITKLKEYRESLIYEAVTGKIDLRDYEADVEDLNWEDYGKVAEVNEPY